MQSLENISFSNNYTDSPINLFCNDIEIYEAKKIFDYIISTKSNYKSIKNILPYIDSAFYLQNSLNSHFRISITTGKNSSITIFNTNTPSFKDFNEYNKNPEKIMFPKTAIYCKVYNVNIMIPSNCNIEAIHKLVMISDYTLTKLRDKKTKKKEKEKLLLLKKSIEQNLQDIIKNKIDNIDFDISKYIEDKKLSTIQEKAKCLAIIKLMIKKDIIPDMEYPLSFNALNLYIPKIYKKYQIEKKKELRKNLKNNNQILALSKKELKKIEKSKNVYEQEKDL